MVDYATFQATHDSLGRKGGAITASDSADLDPRPKAIEVTASGTLSVLPVGNADGEWVDLGSPPAGYRAPYRVRRVKESSTATVIGIWD